MFAHWLTGFGLVRVMLGYDDFFGGQQHHHLPTFKSWKLFDDAVRLKVAANPLEQTDTELLVRHFPATVTQRYLRLVAFAEEPDQVSQLDLVVAIVGTRPEFDFLDLYLLELELGFVRALRLPVLELAEIHDPAHGGLGQRRDLDQVEFRRFRSCDCIRNGHDTELLTICTYQPDFGGVDLSVDPLCFVLGYRVTPRQ